MFQQNLNYKSRVFKYVPQTVPVTSESCTALNTAPQNLLVKTVLPHEPAPPLISRKSKAQFDPVSVPASCVSILKAPVSEHVLYSMQQ